MDSRGKKLTFRFESVEPAVPFLPLESESKKNRWEFVRRDAKGEKRVSQGGRRDVGSESEREVASEEGRKKVNDRRRSAASANDSARLAHATDRFALERRVSPRRKDEA